MLKKKALNLINNKLKKMFWTLKFHLYRTKNYHFSHHHNNLLMNLVNLQSRNSKMKVIINFMILFTQN